MWSFYFQMLRVWGMSVGWRLGRGIWRIHTVQNNNVYFTFLCPYYVNYNIIKYIYIYI